MMLLMSYHPVIHFVLLLSWNGFGKLILSSNLICTFEGFFIINPSVSLSLAVLVNFSFTVKKDYQENLNYF